MSCHFDSEIWSFQLQIYFYLFLPVFWYELCFWYLFYFLGHVYLMLFIFSVLIHIFFTITFVIFLLTCTVLLSNLFYLIPYSNSASASLHSLIYSWFVFRQICWMSSLFNNSLLISHFDDDDGITTVSLEKHKNSYWLYLYPYSNFLKLWWPYKPLKFALLFYKPICTWYHQHLYG